MTPPKPLAQYLADHSGSHEAALSAMHADLTAQHGATDREAGANIRARTIAQALTPLAEALDIPLPEPGQRPTQDAGAALEQGVQDALAVFGDLQAAVETWQELAQEAGLDVQAVLTAQDDTRAESLIDGWLGGLTDARESGAAARQELNVYRFAHANGLNPDAVLLQKGLDGLEQRDVTTRDSAGKDVTARVWGIPGEGEAFVPALDHLKPVLGALRAGPQEPQGTAWVGGQESRGDNAPRSPFASIRPAAEGQQAPAAVNPFTFTTGGKTA
ncbi:hypothetical protein [Deinococcus petrolearius]|uniref:Uncharacterized protein n=1 Tax=Deinococcus petrolearius TaxID=1751295 RepID=A0ABW1DG01_9DEIO